jgi:competence protein ComEC
VDISAIYQKKFMKFSFIFFLILLIIFFLFDRQNQPGVYFFDVGQGDSALIRTKSGQNILIDGGPDVKAAREMEKVLPWRERTVDLMVLTHPHDDHVSGLSEVLKRYEVKKILYTGAIHTAPAFLNWLEILKEKKLKITLADRPQTIQLGEGECLQIFYPFSDIRKEAASNLNNTSVVLKYLSGGKTFLFMGDIEKEVEEDILKKNLDLKADVLKLGHHGSDTSSSEEFLQSVSPSEAIVSAGKDNQFGHPSRRVLSRLRKNGIKFIETAQAGTIYFANH